MLLELAPSHADVRATLIRTGAVAAIILALAQLVPGADPTSAIGNVVLWGSRFTGLFLCLSIAEYVITRVTSDALPGWSRRIVMPTLVALLPASLLEIQLEQLFPQPSDHDDAGSFMARYLSEYATLLSIILPMNLVLWLLLDRQSVDTDVRTPDVNVTRDTLEPAFLEKAKGIQMEDVIAIAAEEHYIRVITLTDSELIYYRFRDAVAEIPIDLGAQVHRSWWIALAHVRGKQRIRRTWHLTLANGDQVPVSKNRLKDARRLKLIN
ncbi:MAG: LytTR family DNA-binding domain-containing protein [Pseudomonadota bacterium]